MKPRFLFPLLLALATESGAVCAQAWIGEPTLAAVPVVRANESIWEDHIETDRDSFTPATTAAGDHRLIVESAYTFLDNRGIPETHSFPELLFRYGLNESIEFRLGWNYEVGGAGNTASGTDLVEFGEEAGVERDSNLYCGLKLAATRQNGWMPESAMILQGYYPTSGEVMNSQVVLTYVFGWELFDDWKLDSAIRFGTGTEPDGNNYRLWAPSTVLRVPIGERWNLHGEYFSVISQGKADDFGQHYFSPGLHYLLTPNLEVGVRLGWGLNNEAANFFSNVGFGWRW